MAVVDSGVYFSPHIKSALGPQIGQLFQGQADFVADGICPGPGTQYSDHCFTNSAQTYDGHGHGSHVAGLIWNNFTDLDTGVYQGIAPGTNILSVRVLGTDGTGRYADVVEGIQYVVANKEAYNIRVMNISLSAYVTTPYFEDPLNRAVEQAWASGIVVVAPAGNIGPDAESITVLDDNNKLDR